MLVAGNDPVSLASGVHWYLKYVANCSVSWWGDQLANLPATGPIPPPASPIRMSTTYQHRYYFNVCTFGYSTFAWCGAVLHATAERRRDWARWEREIDWMALNSINMPLAFTGQEHVFLQVCRATCHR